MSHKKFNIFSETQTLFGSGDSFGGWEVTSTNGELMRIDGKGFYPTYVPGNRPGHNFIKNVLLLFSTGTGDIVLKSPWVSAKPDYIYMVSSFFAVEGVDGRVTLDLEVNSSPTGTGDTYATDTSLSEPVSVDLDNGNPGILFHRFSTLLDTLYVRMVLTFTGQDSNPLVPACGLFLYDPVISEDNVNDAADFSKLMYSRLPAFMRLDDENISSISDSPEILPYPLLRFVESLTAPVAEIADLTTSFDYLRPTDGVESKSTLTDPDTAKVAYLSWLADVTGTTLLTAASGFTPWGAFDGFDWDDFDFLDGIDSSDDSLPWFVLQQYNTDFFDTIQGYRDQIRTGFSGINAGRSDTIESYVRTLLQSSTSATDVVGVKTGHQDSPYRVQLLIDPTVDPDASGTLVSDAVNASLTVGASATRTGSVVEFGEGSYDMSALLHPATESDTASGGVVVYGKSFVSDRDGYARHILLNENSASATVPELGGGVGNAHFGGGSQYFYGDVSSSSYGSLITNTSSQCAIGGSASDGFDIIVTLSDLTPPTASLDTAGSGGLVPANWLFREKRLLVAGVESGGTDNDWALYVVSGLTPQPDASARILFVEGYQNMTGTNYAYSEAINLNELNHAGEFVLRVSRSELTNGDATVEFFAQNSLYDDWDVYSLGSSTITPNSGTATSDAQIQVLGELSSVGWASAGPASCAIRRVMIFNTPLNFVGQTTQGLSSPAYIDGGGTPNFGSYTYVPTVDIDLSAVDVYASTFTATGPTNIQTTVVEAASNDLDILAMRRIGGETDFWYFGAAASGGDTLSIDGLTASTIHDVKVTVYSVTDGTETEYTHSVATDGSGVLTIDAQDTYTGSTTYAGSSIKQISVEESSVEVAKFLSTTIAVTDTTGADSVNASNTWTLTRTFPASSVAYAPSQLVDKEFMHMYEGSLKLNKPLKIETYMPFSVVFNIRRFWNSGTFDIFKLHNVDSDGLTVYFEDDYLKASFTNSTVVERVEWQETGYGEWHTVVVRRDANGNFSLVVDGVEEDVSAAAVVLPFENEISSSVLGHGAASEFNARFGLSQFAMFERYLEDNEITLLVSQLS